MTKAEQRRKERARKNRKLEKIIQQKKQQEALEKEQFVKKVKRECRTLAHKEDAKHNNDINTAKLRKQEAEEADRERKKFAIQQEKLRRRNAIQKEKNRVMLNNLLTIISQHPELYGYISDILCFTNAAYRVAKKSPGDQYKPFIDRREQAYRQMVLSYIQREGVTLAQRALGHLNMRAEAKEAAALENIQIIAENKINNVCNIRFGSVKYDADSRDSWTFINLVVTFLKEVGAHKSHVYYIKRFLIDIGITKETDVHYIVQKCEHFNCSQNTVLKVHSTNNNELDKIQKYIYETVISQANQIAIQGGQDTEQHVFKFLSHIIDTSVKDTLQCVEEPDLIYLVWVIKFLSIYDMKEVAAAKAAAETAAAETAEAAEAETAATAAKAAAEPEPEEQQSPASPMKFC